MNQDELNQAVKAKLSTRDAITASYIQQKHNVLQMQARACIALLQEQGLIGKQWSPALGGYPILKEGMKA